MFASRALKFSMRICILVGRPCYFTPLQETRTLSTEGTKGPAWSPFPTYRWLRGAGRAAFSEPHHRTARARTHQTDRLQVPSLLIFPKQGQLPSFPELFKLVDPEKFPYYKKPGKFLIPLS